MDEEPATLASRLTGRGDALADLLGLEDMWGTRARSITQPLGERLNVAGAPPIRTIRARSTRLGGR
jgi:hypothetical protein